MFSNLTDSIKPLSNAYASATVAPGVIKDCNPFFNKALFTDADTDPTISLQPHSDCCFKLQFHRFLLLLSMRKNLKKCHPIGIWNKKSHYFLFPLQHMFRVFLGYPLAAQHKNWSHI